MKRGFNVLYGAFSVHCIRQKSIDTPLISGKALFVPAFKYSHYDISPTVTLCYFLLFYALSVFSLFRCRISENLKLQAKTKKRELT